MIEDPVQPQSAGLLFISASFQIARISFAGLARLPPRSGFMITAPSPFEAAYSSPSLPVWLVSSR